jgi:phosphopantothenoylcysteine decarboxylase/phosphopantothenate--cysteine ligase
MACGLADEIVSTLALSVSAPILIAPAMNQRMWAHAAVQANVETLRSRGATIVDPVDGWLACRDFGPGRMAEPSVIAGAIEQQLLLASPKAHQDPAS